MSNDKIDTIHKYPIEITNRQSIKLPLGYAIINVGFDHEDRRISRLCIWAAVNTESTMMDVEIIIVGTGHPLPHVGDHLGTVVDGSFIWHVFTGPGSSRGFQPGQGLHYLTRNNLKRNGDNG